MSLLLDHLWQSTVVLAVIGLLTVFFRKNGAHVRHALWTAASLKLLLPFACLTAVGGFVSHLFSSPPPALPVLTTFQGAAQPFSYSATFAAATSTRMNWLPLLVAAWGVGFLTVCCVWLVRWQKQRSMLHAAREVEMAAPMKVKISSGRLEAGLIGIVHPVLLLPEGIAEKLSPAELEAIVAHEACHMRRRDNLFAALHMLVEALYWFWPPVWWLGARMITERERACDEAVLRSGSDPQVYAEGILKVCKHYVSSPLACASGISGADLKRRMEDIMENTVVARLNLARKAMLVVSAIAVLALPLLLGVCSTSDPLSDVAPGTTNPGSAGLLRRMLDGIASKRPDFAEMSPDLAKATVDQKVGLEKLADDLGPVKSISFRQKDGENDLYAVEMEKGALLATIGPTKDGKLSTLFFQPLIKREGNSPSPGLEAALRRLLEGHLSGSLPTDIMSPGLLQAATQQREMISADARRLGAVRSVDFREVNDRGWDVYDVSYENGTSITEAAPLKDGKLTGVLMHDILLPHEPQHPGTEDALRRHIESHVNGQPNYDEMTPPMAAVVKEQLPGTLAMIKPWGALRSIAFKGGDGGGGPETMDVYEVTFEHAKVRWSIGLDASGKVARATFHPIP
jgi:beta-lactamase regulating signal transducer with metallopeptidase domain